MESGRKFEYLRGNEEQLPEETHQEKLLRLLAVQHPVEKTLPQAEFTVLDILKQIHPEDPQTQ